jgi:hypothetical protein
MARPLAHIGVRPPQQRIKKSNARFAGIKVRPTVQTAFGLASGRCQPAIEIAGGSWFYVEGRNA